MDLDIAGHSGLSTLSCSVFFPLNKNSNELFKGFERNENAHGHE